MNGPDLSHERRESFTERVRHSFPLFLLVKLGPVAVILIAGWLGLFLYVLLQFYAAMNQFG